jgi:hypothetical protein
MFEISVTAYVDILVCSITFLFNVVKSSDRIFVHDFHLVSE